MRKAYSGRAAAYEKTGDLEKALADHNMVVTYYAIEVEILNGLAAPERDKLLTEAAGAYLARGNCQELLGREKAALADRQRANDLQANARNVASEAAKTKAVPAGHFRFENAWTQAVTIAVAGVTYRLEVGEQKTIPAPDGSVVGQIRTGANVQTSTLEAGKAYRIR
jgi:tetratricopeptide (TPR) repeat protein